MDARSGFCALVLSAFIVSACMVPQEEGDAHDQVAVRAEQLPQGMLPTDAAPYVDATMTRHFVPANGSAWTNKPNLGATAIKELFFNYLISGAQDVKPATDIHLAVYDWDVFWNQVNWGMPSWPNNVCGSYCCGEYQQEGPLDCPTSYDEGIDGTPCANVDCSMCTQTGWSFLQERLDAGLDIKAIFNQGKSKKNVRAWLAKEIAEQRESPYRGVRTCSRGKRNNCEDGGSCLGQKDMHTKMMLVRKFFTDAYPFHGGAEYTSAITSANFDEGQLPVWNDLVAVYNDRVLYEGLQEYFEKMWEQSIEETDSKTYYAYPEQHLSKGATFDGSLGIVRAYLFPRNEHVKDTTATSGGLSSDVVKRILSYAQTGTVLVVASKFAEGRSLYNELIKLVKKTPRVDVRVIVRDSPDDQVDKCLAQELAAAGVKVFMTKPGQKYGMRNEDADPELEDVVGVSIHHKFILTAGRYYNDVFQRNVFTGTHNLTNAGLRENDEVMFKIKECQDPPCNEPFSWTTLRTGKQVNNQVYVQYADQWNALCKHVVRWATDPNPNDSTPISYRLPAPGECELSAAHVSCYKESCYPAAAPLISPLPGLTENCTIDCRNGLDDDKDGKIDWSSDREKLDTGCMSSSDPTE